MSNIDLSKAILTEKGYRFEPFRPTRATPLAKANYAADHELIVIARAEKYLAFSMPELSYHHAAQGELAGEPYLVSF
jgi:hypothetical protein